MEKLRPTGRDLNEVERAIHSQRVITKAARLAVIGAGRPDGGPLVDNMHAAYQDLNELRGRRTQTLHAMGRRKDGKPNPDVTPKGFQFP